MKKTYTETRILPFDKLRSLCCEHGWYTEGTNKDAENLYDLLHDEYGCLVNMTTEMLARVAEDIVEHSDITDYTITTVMSALACACFTYFEVA